MDAGTPLTTPPTAPYHRLLARPPSRRPHHPYRVTEGNHKASEGQAMSAKVSRMVNTRNG